MLVGVASAAEAAEAALLTTALSAPAEVEEVPEAEVLPRWYKISMTCRSRRLKPVRVIVRFVLNKQHMLKK